MAGRRTLRILTSSEYKFYGIIIIIIIIIISWTRGKDADKIKIMCVKHSLTQTHTSGFLLFGSGGYQETKYRDHLELC